MKLRESAKEVIAHEMERFRLIREELFKQGVAPYELSEMTMCIYLERRNDIEMVTDDYN